MINVIKARCTTCYNPQFSLEMQSLSTLRFYPLILPFVVWISFLFIYFFWLLLRFYQFILWSPFVAWVWYFLTLNPEIKKLIDHIKGTNDSKSVHKWIPWTLNCVGMVVVWVSDYLTSISFFSIILQFWCPFVKVFNNLSA